VVLYAAPVWSERVATTRRNRETLNNLMRTINLRVIAGYRTVSLEAASVLAGIPPLHLLTSMRRRVYLRMVDLREKGCVTERDMIDVRRKELLLTHRQWILYLRRPGISGRRTIDAALPSIEIWLDRTYGGMDFHLTQLLTGHGCFGSYLHRIQKLDTAVCLHCGSGKEDSAKHTLQECDAWEADREELIKVIGNDLRLETVMRAMGAQRKLGMQ